jgi:ribonuclease HI
VIIRIYAASTCRDNGRPTQMASAGVVLVVENDIQVKKRSMAFALGSSSSVLSEIQSVRLGLASVLVAFRKNIVELHTPSHYVIDMMKSIDNEYIRKPYKYVEQIADMRKLLESYQKLSVFLNSDSKEILEARQLARSVLDTQKNIDF